MNAITEYLSQYFDELEPKEFYRVIFPKGELDEKGADSPEDTTKLTPQKWGVIF